MEKLKEIFRDRATRANFIKTVAITVLICTTVVLFGAVFNAQNIKMTDDKVENSAIEGLFKNPSDIDDENIANTFWDYTSPEYIVVNKEGCRDILYSSTEAYVELCAPSMEIVRGMYENVVEHEVIANTEVWQNMLSVNSVLLHFPANIYPEFQMQFLGIDESPIMADIDNFSDILIVTGLPEQTNAILYVKEARSEKIVRIKTDMPVKDLNGVISSMRYVTDKNYVFAYELRLDRFSGNQTMMSSMLTIPLVNIKTSVLSANVPENFSQKLREVGQNELSRNVLNIFGCDPDTIRSYADVEDSRILLGKDRRIELSSDGIIEFSADDSEAGIDITGGTVQTEANSLYVAISGTLKIILGMFETTGTDIKNADYEIKLTSMSHSKDYQSEVRLCFDYYINGLVMEYVDDPDSHAIEAVISKGKLIYFKMELKNFVKTGETVSNDQMMAAIDEYCSKQNRENVYIYDSYLYYGYKKNDENMRTGWAVN